MMAKQPTTPTYTRLASASSPTCAARWKRWRCSHDQQANTRHWPVWRTRRLARCSHQRHTNEEWGDLWLPWVRVAVVMATRDKTPAEDASVLELATFNDGEMIDGIENARRHLHCLVGVLDKAMERITAVMAEAGRTRETLNDNLN
jgi:hypothetical protein